MAKYLAKARYRSDGARALMKDGGSSRVAGWGHAHSEGRYTRRGIVGGSHAASRRLT